MDKRTTAAEVVGELYDELREAGASAGKDPTERVCEMRAQAGLPETLKECGIPADALPRLASEAAEQWTAGFNPRPVTRAGLLGLYEAAHA